MADQDKKTGTITKISQKDTFTVKNDIKMHSENGINLSSAQKIQIKADKTSYKDHEPINNQIPGTTVVHLGVFFDGTQNNAYNSKLRKEQPEKLQQLINAKKISDDKTSSYWNDYSNVSKMHGFYKSGKVDITKNKITTTTCYVPVYVEGIATFKNLGDDYYNDDMVSLMTGRGMEDVMSSDEMALAKKYGMKTDENAGVEGKVNLAINKYILDAFKDNNVPKGYKAEKGLWGVSLPMIDELQIDVYGFSRGSAAARHFLNQINHSGTPAQRETREQQLLKNGSAYTKINKEVIRIPAGGSLGKKLADAGYQINDTNIHIRFVGLYDTVPSITSDSEIRLVKWGKNIAKTGVIVPNVSTPFAIIAGASLAWIGEKAVARGTQNDDNAPLQLSMAKINAKCIYHMAAQNEYRKNFRLSKNDSAWGDLYYHGAHSDIGGGYETAQVKQSLSLPITLKFTCEKDQSLSDKYFDDMAPDALKQERNSLISEGFFENKKENIFIDKIVKHHYYRVPNLDKFKSILEKIKNSDYLEAIKSTVDVVTEIATDVTTDIGLASDKRYKWLKRYEVTYQLKGDRLVNNALPKIYLMMMFFISKEMGVPLDETINYESKDFKVPAELENVKKEMFGSVSPQRSIPKISNEELVLMRSKYVHVSWSYDSIQDIFIDVIMPYEPESRIEPYYPEQKDNYLKRRTREIGRAHV